MLNNNFFKYLILKYKIKMNTLFLFSIIKEYLIF